LLKGSRVGDDSRDLFILQGFKLVSKRIENGNHWVTAQLDLEGGGG
jgi:hypothetical protein